MLTKYVTIHGAVRLAARPPSDKVMEPVGHPAHCRRQLWMAGCRYSPRPVRPWTV